MIFLPRKALAAVTAIVFLCVCGVAVFAAFTLPSYFRELRSAKEAVLKEDLQTMRAAIGSYREDTKKAPETLHDLICSGYLKAIPTDPMTGSNSTWIGDRGNTSSSHLRPARIHFDIHSDSRRIGVDGQPYASW
jgi:general secretion pathway protein G